MRALPGRLARAVDIEDQEAVAPTIGEAPEVRTAGTVVAQIVSKLLAQGVQTGAIDIREKTAERRAVREADAAEEGHKWVGKRGHAGEEGLQGRLAAERIAQQDDDEVDHVVPTGTPAREFDLLAKGFEHAALREVPGKEDQFGKPGRDGRNVMRTGMDLNGRGRTRRHLDLLRSSGEPLLIRKRRTDLTSTARALLVAHLVGTIELLFKLWKSHGHSDESRSGKPWRVLCEVYAKLLAMVLQHWLLLTGCWAYPDRSLVKAAQTVRLHALHLASALAYAPALQDVIALLHRCLAAGCRLNRRKKTPNTYQLLLDPTLGALP